MRVNKLSEPSDRSNELNVKNHVSVYIIGRAYKIKIIEFDILSFDTFALLDNI